MKFNTSWFWFPTGLINFNVRIDHTPWWIEVCTAKPKCLYYFGPFDTLKEAQDHQDGYIEDLREENAQGIQWTIKRIQPKALTIVEEEEELVSPLA